MLIASIVLTGSDVRLAFALLALFIAVNGLGWVMWLRRGTRSHRTSYCSLVALIGVATLAALFAIVRTGHWEEIQIGGSLPPAAAMAFVVCTVCILLVQIVRTSRRRST